LERGLPTDRVESLGILRRREYRQLLRYLRWLLEPDPFRELSRAECAKLAGMLAPFGMYWWRFYEHPLHVHLGIVMRLTGSEEAYVKAASGGQRAAVEYLMCETDSDELGPLQEVNPQHVSLLFNSVIALRYSIEAACYFKLTIHELLERAKNGDLSALRDAVSIDKGVVATPIGAAVIARAQLSGDVAALTEVLGASTPPQKRRKYKELRFMVRVLEEAGALDSGVSKEVIELITKDLRLHTEVGGDAAKNVRDLIRLFRKGASE
jgi:hypothetical protein